MPKFTYQVLDQQKVTQNGSIEAPTVAEAQKFLEENNYEVVKIKKEGSLLNFQDILKGFQKIKQADFNFFVRQLATLLKAGVPMLQCLDSLREEAQDKVLKNVLDHLYDDVSGGTSLSDATARHPKFFDGLFIATIRAGEASGELDTVLARLADIIEKDYITREKIKSALRYPLFVISAMLLAFLVAVTFIIPRFSVLFDLFGGDLPLPTRILQVMSFVTINYWYLCILAIVGLTALYTSHYRTPKGQRFWDQRFLDMPVAGLFIKVAIYARFSRMMGIMLKSGVPILDVLRLMSSVAGNAVIGDKIIKIREEVSQGDQLSVLMKRSEVFPNLMIQMVSVGEATGKMDELLLLVSDHYDAELDRLTKNMESLIEPLFIVMLAIFVLVLALGIFLPMWDLYGLIGTGA